MERFAEPDGLVGVQGLSLSPSEEVLDRDDMIPSVSGRLPVLIQLELDCHMVAETHARKGPGRLPIKDRDTFAIRLGVLDPLSQQVAR